MIAKLLKTAALAAPAFAMLAAAQPASASDGSAGAAAASAGAAMSAKASAQAAPKKICATMVPDTASRMARKVCKTKAEWAEEGVELRTKK